MSFAYLVSSGVNVAGLTVVFTAPTEHTVTTMAPITNVTLMNMIFLAMRFSAVKTIYMSPKSAAIMLVLKKLFIQVLALIFSW
jgi:hypothetical protein